MKRCICLRWVVLTAPWVLAVGSIAVAQTNPAAQNLPLNQNWGSANFTSMPAGFGAWNGLNGDLINSQAAAENSAPTGNATVAGSAPGAAGGCYGYAVSSDARFGIVTSGNLTNGVNQLAMAINTMGHTNVTLTYSLINVTANLRTVGAICQYRVGTSGAWTSLGGTNNPYVQSGGSAGTTTSASITLPAAAENQSVVQIRWAVWRGGEGGNSSAFAIDNINVVAGGGSSGPSAFAGSDRILALNGGSVDVLMTDATASDPDGFTGLTYAWTPASGAGISGWTNRTGSVIDATTPSDAQVTLNATGIYVFTLTVTDPTFNIAGDSVTITVVNSNPGGQYDPPANYYDPARPGGVWLTGAALKTALRNIIDDHEHRSYDAAKAALAILDQDPNNPNNVILIYTGDSVSKTWNGNTWNREHQWPDSLNSNSNDLFNLRPCNPGVNNSRGNDPFGLGSGYWDPDHGAPDRGDCARAMFYMATRYSNLTLVNGQPGSNEMGDLSKLLEWHFSDPVAVSERRRNHLMYSSADNPGYYQGNRNPFIDHPELMWTIFGAGGNDSKLYLGLPEPSDGSSSANVSFTVIENAVLPSSSVTLNKIGSIGTSYNVTISSDATSTAAGSGQTFSGGSQSRNITFGISSTSTTGAHNGTVTIDNTDLTSSAAGRGSADGNDTVNISASVLDHADASLSMPEDHNALTIDFGLVAVGSGVVTQNAAIYNLVNTPDYTAGLDLDAVNGTGHTGILSTNLVTFINLAAGGNQPFIASFNTAASGSFSATYTLVNSDQNLPGATGGTNLVLTLVGVVFTPAPADFNRDGYVDQVDVEHFETCQTRDTIPQTDPLCEDADLDADGDVDMNDLGRVQRCMNGISLADPNCAN